MRQASFWLLVKSDRDVYGWDIMVVKPRHNSLSLYVTFITFICLFIIYYCYGYLSVVCLLNCCVVIELTKRKTLIWGGGRAGRGLSFPFYFVQDFVESGEFFHSKLN